MPLESEDQQHLTAAQGYVELGTFLDANVELEKIDPDVRHVPEVLDVRGPIYCALAKWELMQTLGKKLANYDSDDVQWIVSWTHATRRAVSIDAAKVILLEAVERLPKVATLHYNLACYACQLSDVEVAKARLQHAFRIDPKLRLTALDDPDLEAVRRPPDVK